eukprot:1593219-Amphidinium_carterae.1
MQVWFLPQKALPPEHKCSRGHNVSCQCREHEAAHPPILGGPQALHPTRELSYDEPRSGASAAFACAAYPTAAQGNHPSTEMSLTC